MKKLSRVTLFSLALFTACQSNPVIENQEPIAQQQETTISIPQKSRQILKVITPNWEAKEGTLQRYERSKEGWQKVGKEISIILGRNGLGWGRGLHTIPSDAPYIKKEGDGKAPAGLFTLGHGFGYNDFAIAFPYAVYKTTDHCVDDDRSQWYNRIVDSTHITKDYNSFEQMKLHGIEYKYGITVNHNPDQVAQGGSCIFIHIRNDTNKGTAGCTAMREGEIKEILQWLNPNAHPLLLQLPQTEVEKIEESSLK